MHWTWFDLPIDGKHTRRTIVYVPPNRTKVLSFPPLDNRYVLLAVHIVVNQVTYSAEFLGISLVEKLTAVEMPFEIVPTDDVQVHFMLEHVLDAVARTAD